MTFLSCKTQSLFLTPILFSWQHFCSRVLPQPVVVNASLVAASYDQHGITRFFQHVCSVEDQEYLRHLVEESGCVAFVRDGSVLPRENSTSDLPMLGERPVPFQSPPGPLRHTFQLIHAGHVTGLLIPKGVTVVCGGWCQGKSTLLQALSVGMYNKVPGDGREFVCTLPTTTMVQSEKGRSVSAVDITPFATQVRPHGPSTRAFTTGQASGNTSQAAGVMEALEMGASALLMDEGTSATAFLVRDSRMQQLLVQGEGEATLTTPFLHVVQALRVERGVSSILVGSGCGDYLEVADVVIMMEHYLPRDATVQAKEIVRSNGGPSLPNNSSSNSSNDNNGGGGGGGDVGGYTMKVGSGLSLMKVDNSMSGVSGGSGGGSGFQSNMNGGGDGNGNGNNGNGSSNGGGSKGSNGVDDSETTNNNNSGTFANVGARILRHNALQVVQEKRSSIKVLGKTLTVLQFGAVDIDIAALQFVDVSQVRAVAHILEYIHKHKLCDGERSLAMVLDEIELVVKTRGLDGIACFSNLGDLALPRRAEIAAAINRIRTLKVVVAPDNVYHQPIKQHGAQTTE